MSTRHFLSENKERGMKMRLRGAFLFAIAHHAVHVTSVCSPTCCQFPLTYFQLTLCSKVYRSSACKKWQHFVASLSQILYQH
ncbi:hypothetical protein BDW02DRAFT_396387 [Decorospora gaudefroyi]|uniref:Uncharacterized protein n=1 Tax=Decorospora gaudefroyi TaxID=184978 RepID=A0A6A5K601_9PLEO|nr:hypothetical protein BDW02DRAFT_396387 [Decorospora gaudefroyi]